MEFKGIGEKGAEFVANDSEIATARLGFVASGDEESLSCVPYPSLNGSTINLRTAELVVSGNIALLNSVGKLREEGEFRNVRSAVKSGVVAIELAGVDLGSKKAQLERTESQ